MAKVTTTTCKKFRRTVHVHGIRTPLLLGSLELIWQAAASRQGDSFEPWEIESIAEWDGEPNALLNALVRERWLDPEFGPDGELTLCHVHDFDEHCPRYVKALISRKVRKQTTEYATQYRTELHTECATECHTDEATTNTNTNTNTRSGSPKDLELNGATTLRGGCKGGAAADAASAAPQNETDSSQADDPQPKAPLPMPELAPVVNGEALPVVETENHTTEKPKCPIRDFSAMAQDVFDSWVEAAEESKKKYGDGLGLVKPRRQLSENPDLLRKIKIRLQDKSWREDWRERLADVASMPFCNGVLSDYDLKNGRKPWKMDIDYFVSSHGVLRKIASWKDRADTKSARKGSFTGNIASFEMGES